MSLLEEEEEDEKEEEEDEKEEEEEEEDEKEERRGRRGERGRGSVARGEYYARVCHLLLGESKLRGLTSTTSSQFASPNPFKGKVCGG